MRRVFFLTRWIRTPWGFHMGDVTEGSVQALSVVLLGTMTWKRHHLLPTRAGCREVPWQISQTACHTSSGKEWQRGNIATCATLSLAHEVRCVTRRQLAPRAAAFLSVPAAGAGEGALG